MKNAFEYEAEIAALREELAAEKKWYDTEIDEVTRRLADAERQEPVAVVVEESHKSLGFLLMNSDGSKYHPPVTTMKRNALLLNHNVPVGTNLYTSPPAPVAVVLPSPTELQTLVTEAAQDSNLIAGANYYTAAELAANYLLSKVKELNQ